MPEYPKPISKQCTQKILEQMSNAFFKIKDNNEICFFSKIKYKNLNIPVLITNYKIINYIANHNNINVYINNDLQAIKLGNIQYFNINNNLAIIEIKENENNKIIYLELDENLSKKEYETFYKNESIYTINYKDEKDINVIYSIIYNINNSEIIYSNHLIKVENISLIFNLSNNKLLGIHLPNSKSYNKGILFNFIMKDFINEYKKCKFEKNQVNEIDLIVNVDTKDINKNIYFLNNDYYNNKIKELNDINTEIYINNKKSKYKNYITPEKEGKYNIKLKYKINLTNCDYMFSNCEKITHINFKLNPKYITSMKCMFHKCKNLKLINFLSFNAQNVTDMSDMFSFCENLNNLDLTSFNAKNIKNMSYMFYFCYNLTDLKLFSFDIKNTINMDYMFDMCSKLKLETVPNNIKTNNNSINKYSNEVNILIKVGIYEVGGRIYFLDNYVEYDEIRKKKYFRNNLRELNDINTELYINDKKYKYEKYFIPEKEGEYNIKLKFNINLTDCSYMFSNCENIYQINFISFNTSHLTNMYRMFYYCSNLNNLNLSSFDTKNVTDMCCLFSGCENLINLDISSFYTKNIINMSYMFYCCKKLTKLNLSNFITNNVKNMKYMFFCCNSLNNLNLSSFNTKNVNNMSYMFCGCESLKDLNISSFDTKNVINMESMFRNCENLIILELYSFDTKNVINMSYMFYHCSQLNNLDLSSFDTKNVIDMRYMFYECENLFHLNISSFDTKNVKSFKGMLYDCPDEIYESNISKFENFEKDLLYEWY